MAVNLSKGQKVDLTKGNPGLSKLIVGLGWDTNRYDGGADFDLDAAAFLVGGNGKVASDADFVFYGNLQHASGGVVHTGDNLTGAGDGDDEQILVDLTALPEVYDKVVFVVNIYQAAQRRQHFGLIENAFIRICDAETGKELCKYNLSENYDGMTAMVFGEIYRRGQDWKFNAIGQPTQDNGIEELARRFT